MIGVAENTVEDEEADNVVVQMVVEVVLPEDAELALGTVGV